MDEWNYTPINEQQPTPSEPTPVPPVEPTPVPPSEPTPPPAPMPSEPTPQPIPPYAQYGWQNYTPPPPKKRGGGAAVAIAVVCVAVVAVLGILLASAYRGLDLGGVLPSDGDEGVTDSTPEEDKPTLNIVEPVDGADGLTTREIVKQNIDSTVLITIYENTVTMGNGFPFGQDQWESEEQESGSASGIVMSADGYIITNWHCVINEETDEPFARLDVTTYDGTVYENATVVGADSSTDLAVIKVDATDLQPAVFGDSTALELGDRVIAIGNAGGLGWSATQGIVSGLARDVYEDTGYAIKCLQVDAAINPGNSGGPLFNALGQVVAVNSAKIVASGYEGLGFAIPINEAKEIVDKLIENGYVTGRVSLGIQGQTYSDAYYQGFLIYSIEEDSPLRDTNAQKGDLITAVDGETVTDYATLRAALAKHEVGDTVTLTLLRSRSGSVKSYNVDVTLKEATE